MNILFFGDIFAHPGRQAIKEYLPEFRKSNKLDLCIANCENLSNGRGVSEKSIIEMQIAGVDIFSSGNHLYDQKDHLNFINKSDIIAKPLNFPKAAFGAEYVKKCVNGAEMMLISLCGQSFMNHAVNSPVSTLEFFLDNSQNLPKIIIVDFHAESTAEKRTLGYYFDGKISAMLGTHTHIQTADEEILDGGTAYITDVGMCGSHDSVIGIKKDIAIQKIRSGMPVKHEPAESGLQINAIFLTINDLTGKAEKINRIKEKL